MFQYAVVRKCLDDQFNSDTVQVAAGYADDGFSWVHSFLITGKNNDFPDGSFKQLYDHLRAIYDEAE